MQAPVLPSRLLPVAPGTWLAPSCAAQPGSVPLRTGEPNSAQNPRGLAACTRAAPCHRPPHRSSRCWARCLGISSASGVDSGAVHKLRKSPSGPALPLPRAFRHGQPRHSAGGTHNRAPPQSRLLLGLCLGLKGSWWAPMGGFEGGLPHPLVTLGPGNWALLLGGGSCATAVPAHPERIPVRGAGDIPDLWGHQKGTPDPADTRGERGDPLSRAWPVGVPGDTSAPPRDPPRGHVLAPSPALPPAPAASSDAGPGDATGVLAGTSEPGRFWRGVGLPFGGLQPWWGCWNGEGRTDGRGGSDRRPDSCARRLRCRAGRGARSKLPAPNPICPQHAAGRHRAPEGIFVRC